MAKMCCPSVVSIRIIILLLVMSKIESTLNWKYSDENNQLFESQHGFWWGFNAATALFGVLGDIIGACDESDTTVIWTICDHAQKGA